MKTYTATIISSLLYVLIIIWLGIQGSKTDKRKYHLFNVLVGIIIIIGNSIIISKQNVYMSGVLQFVELFFQLLIFYIIYTKYFKKIKSSKKFITSLSLWGTCFIGSILINEFNRGIDNRSLITIILYLFLLYGNYKEVLAE